MDKWEALYNFWSSFGIPAYEENSVPKDAAYPYITYEAGVGSFESVVTLSASIWDRTTQGTAFVDNKADEIVRYIKNMRECPRVNGGRYRVYVEGQYATNMGDPDDRLVKRKQMNVNFEFLTD